MVQGWGSGVIAKGSCRIRTRFSNFSGSLIQGIWLNCCKLSSKIYPYNKNVPNFRIIKCSERKVAYQASPYGVVYKCDYYLDYNEGLVASLDHLVAD